MLLKAESVTMSFGGLLAVNDVSIEIEKGRIYGLIGPNGAGKTTFFNLLNGVYKPVKGAMYFDNKRIDGLKPYQINEVGISRTYQIINLFKKMSVIDNVLVGMHPRIKSNFFTDILRTKSQRKDEAESLAEAYNWLDFVDLKHKAEIEAGTLSYGEQRLLEIVRGLASKPKLILLDEPAAGMNTTEKEKLDLILKKILGMGVTILVVEHDMKLMMNVAETIFVLNYGKLLAQGTPEEVQNNPDVIDAYLGGDDYDSSAGA